MNSQIASSTAASEPPRLDGRAARLGLGSIALHAIRVLREYAEGTELSSSELAQELGQPLSGFGSLLLPSAEVGYLRRRIQGNVALWSIGAKPVPDADAPLRTIVPRKQRKSDDERFVELSSAGMVASVFAYAKTRDAAPFSCALSTDGRLTIERHGRVVLELTDAERRQLIIAASQGVLPR